MCLAWKKINIHRTSMVKKSYKMSFRKAEAVKGTVAYKRGKAVVMGQPHPNMNFGLRLKNE
jgi:hypothetical protein